MLFSATHSYFPSSDSRLLLICREPRTFVSKHQHSAAVAGWTSGQSNLANVASNHSTDGSISLTLNAFAVEDWGSHKIPSFFSPKREADPSNRFCMAQARDRQTGWLTDRHTPRRDHRLRCGLKIKFLGQCFRGLWSYDKLTIHTYRHK